MKQKARPQLILFGGTFDPPHRGHLGCVALALQRFPAAKLWVLPAFQPAGASGQHKQAHASYEDRLAMCQRMYSAHLSAADFQRVSISRFEETLPTPNFTVKTLQAVKEQAAYADSSLCFLIGEDQWRNFSRWASPLAILELSSLIIVKRDLQAEASSSLRAQIEDGVQALGLSLTWHDKDCALLSPMNSWIYLIEAAPSQAASTLMRQSLQAKSSLPQDWLTDEVKEYIDNRGLYKEVKGQDS